MKILVYILSLFCFLYTSYFVLIFFGIFKKKKKVDKTDKINKFAILIAARNEELVIGKLLDSLNNQNYDKKYFKTYVLINNCTDNTLNVAKEHKANIIECENVSSKGEVLKIAYDKLKSNKDIDAYVIFDADNVVDSNFLSSMNNVLNEGYNVAQGFRNTKNISDNWLTSSYAILYYLQSLCINKARFKLGKSSFINGTGFMVKKEVIDKYGFDPKTITEDIEFTMMCAINNEKIAYVEDAITYDEQVSKFNVSLKQRKRWSFGSLQCLRYYYKNLLKVGIKEKRFECFDCIMFNSTVILQILATLVSIVFIIINKNLFSFILFSCLLFVFGLIFRIFLVKKTNNSIKDNIWGIFTFDIFLLSWLPVNFICLFKRNCKWDPIIHNRNV